MLRYSLGLRVCLCGETLSLGGYLGSGLLVLRLVVCM